MKQLNIILLGIIISLGMPTVYAQSVRDEIPGGSKKPIGRGDGESSNCDKDHFRVATTAVHYTEHHDVTNNGLVVLVVEKVLSILVTLTSSMDQRISGWKWQSRMKENLVFDH
jgi:hypothetical protein